MTFLLTILESIRIAFVVNWFERSFVCGANVVKLGSKFISFFISFYFF
jgi:hypothetical protein